MIANEEIEVEGKRVLELGCGVGLPGMIAASKGAQMVRFTLASRSASLKLTRREQVVLSDFNDSRMLDDLKDSVDEALVSSDRVRARIVGHTFGESTRPLLAA
jgi:predicted nicotinamide N-methyase